MTDESSNTKSRVLGSLLGGIALAALVLSYLLYFKPRAEARELARETCDELNGAIMLQVGPILNKATGKAGRLGYDQPEFGELMREQCPDTMQALAQWARERDR